MDEYKDLDFGSYCDIEMFRHGAENEMYTHKVIQRVKSNSSVNVPIRYGPGGTGHEEVLKKESSPCIRVVCCGVIEDRIFKVRVAEVKAIPYNN